MRSDVELGPHGAASIAFGSTLPRPTRLESVAPLYDTAERVASFAGPNGAMVSMLLCVAAAFQPHAGRQGLAHGDRIGPLVALQDRLRVLTRGTADAPHRS